MSTPARAPLKLPPMVVIPIIVVCLAIFVGIVSLAIPLSVAGQAYLLIIVLFGFRYSPQVVRWVTRMPIPHRVVFGLLVGSMLIGHYTLKNRTYFPFVAWEIFGFPREEDPVVCREFIATTASGKQVRLLVEQLFPSIVQIDPLNDARHFPPATLEHLVHVAAVAYNEHHADDPVRHVDLVDMAVKLHPPANELRTAPSCEFLKRYDF